MPVPMVRGGLFRDYVRIIRANKALPWRQELSTPIARYVDERVDDELWYPMDAFEQLGLFMLDHMGLDMNAIRQWGKHSVDHLRPADALLIANGDCVESILRFRILRGTFSNFEAIDIVELEREAALVRVCYRLSPRAEEAACFQTLGFLERVLEISGASDIVAAFDEAGWENGSWSVLRLSWALPATQDDHELS